MTDAARLLGGLRLAVGVGTWLAPTASTRLFGLLGATDTASGTVVGRLFAVREAALAAGVLSPDPTVRTATLRAGVAIDAVDSLAVLVSARGLPRPALPLTGGGALVLCALGAWALRQPQSFSRGA